MTEPASDPEAPVRLAMWSGPRNISTAMMRAFENRADCAVVDEPFYAAYLARTGLPHPMAEEVMASQPTDHAAVVRALTGPVPDGARVWYQKHMCQHIPDDDPLDWTAQLTNAFLIRSPRRVVASFARQRGGEPTLAEIGFHRQAAIFAHVRAATGATPPVLDAEDVQADPERALSALCAAVGIPFDRAMLSWPAGPRDSDGVWAPAWYAAVERSTGFAGPSPPPGPLPAALEALAAECEEPYAEMARHRLLA